MPLWWNGRHDRFKICCSHGRAGSSPARGTITLLFKLNGIALDVFLLASNLQVAQQNIQLELPILDLSKI